MRVLTCLVLMLLGVAVSGWSWGTVVTHNSITSWALSSVTDVFTAGEIAWHSGDPDWHRDISPACPSAPCVSDTYGHRISEYMLDEPGHEEISRYGGPYGAELGAWQWTEQAQSAYEAGDARWKTYLGWASHYLADALCPAHCCAPPCCTWTTGDPERESAFEFSFEVANAVLPFLRFVEAGATVTFATGTDIRDWTIRMAKTVAGLPLQSDTVPPYLSPTDLYQVFAWIGDGIRGLYAFVTG